MQKSPSRVLCRTPSQFTFTETKYHKNEITSLYEKLREPTTEMKAMKSFVIVQILLVKNSVNNKFGNNTQLQQKSNEKSLTEEIRHLRQEKKTKTCIIQTLMEDLLKRIKSIDGNPICIK